MYITHVVVHFFRTTDRKLDPLIDLNHKIYDLKIFSLKILVRIYRKLQLF